MKKLVSFIFVLFSLSTFGQSEFEIGLASGTFIPDACGVKCITNKQLRKAIPTYDGKKYLIVQFYKLPTTEQHALLKSSGVLLLSYLPHNAYYVAIPSNSKTTIFDGLAVRALFPISNKMKVHLKIQNKELPSYALEGANYKLMVTMYSTVKTEQTIESLKKIGATILTVFPNEHHLAILIPISKVNELAAMPYVQFIDVINAPPTSENVENKSLHRSNVLGTEYGAGRHYDGTGVQVALTDDGIIGPHIDYQGRAFQSNVTVDNGNHGDHCAGIIGGAGNLDPRGKGMAPGANIWVYDVTNIAASYVMDDTVYTSSSASIDIVSTSYSDGCNVCYNAGANSADRQIYTYNNVMRVFSAGNQGTTDCSYGAGSLWGNITGGIKSGKNVIAVANLDLHDVVASSSSRGPATDGRIKPDISAQGTNVYSSVAPYTYDVYTGTSMSCPGVSGTLAQLYQAYRMLHAGTDPNTGLLKGILLNTADDLGQAGPDFIYGYGRINGNRAIKAIENATYISNSVANGATSFNSIVVPSNIQRLKVMLIWIDKEASVGATTALVNDLDLTVTTPSTSVLLPWVLNPAPNATTLNAPAVQGVDHLNNMEQVTIENPSAGIYSIDVNGFAITTSGNQNYYIVYEMIQNDQLELTYPLGGESFTPGSVEVIRWDAIDNLATFNIDLSTDNGSTWSSLSSNIASSKNYFDWTIPSLVNGTCKIKVTRNGVSSISPASFSIMDTVANLRIVSVCPDTVQLAWNATTGANAYEISMLGNKYMDSVSTTTATSVKIGGITNSQEHWFSVKAKGTLNAISRRCFAIVQSPGLANCILNINATAYFTNEPGNTSINSCASTNGMKVSFDIQNNGLTTISNFPVAFVVDNGTPIVEQVTATLAPAQIYHHSFTASIPNLTAGTHLLKIFSKLASDFFGADDTLMTTIQIVPSVVKTLPWSEDFENFSLCANIAQCDITSCQLINGLTNEENGVMDDIDWKVFQGSTPTTSSGPDMDHKPGTIAGNYIYTEASYCFNNTAKLVTPCFDLTGTANPVMDFWFHMFGAAMGEMHVDGYYDNDWHLDIVTREAGDFGNNWNQKHLNLKSFIGKTIFFRIRGIDGSASTSDMALDDFSLVDSVAIPNVISFVLNKSAITLYPNLSTGNFVIDFTNNTNVISSIDIINTQGVVLRRIQQPVYNKVLPINISEMENAIYFVRIVTVQGEQVVQKLTKI